MGFASVGSTKNFWIEQNKMLFHNAWIKLADICFHIVLSVMIV
jgi:hypothetical protein